MSYKVLGFSIKIGKKEIKNRIVFPPIASNWANSDGTVNEKIIKFYGEVAEGGCGMIIVEGTAISPEGKGASNSLCIYNRKHVLSLRQIAAAIKDNSCFASIQLVHAGGQANPNFTGYEPVSPSGTKCKATGFDSVKLSIEEIQNIRRKFINSAIMAFNAGFQAVELHLAHGYLLHQFLSEYTNKRDDEYGGSVRNRVRLILDIIAGIRKRAPELIIGVRVSGEDYIDNGINEKVNKQILPLLENAGVEYFSVSAGIYDTSKLKHEAMERGEFFNYARGIKKIVKKPVIGVGKILDIAKAEKHLKNRDCDLIAIGRALIADPKMVNKIRDGDEFNKCTECNQCQYLRFGKKNLTCPIRGV